jgi:cell division cycle protein 20 (cofactor of APC complex)
MLNLLRKSAAQLFHSPPPAHPTSCTSNLGTRKQFILALDGPGIPTDPFAYPLSWSLTNCVAVACGINVYYQNLANREISHLCELERPRDGLVQCIAWGGIGRRRDTLALGTTTGTVQLWDARRIGAPIRVWSDPLTSVSAMSWQGDAIAVGWGSGSISLFDVRAKKSKRDVTGHKGKVYGIEWNVDGTYMASGDQHGGVYIWDSRACKSLADGGVRGPKMKHKGAVKVIFLYFSTTCPTN